MLSDEKNIPWRLIFIPDTLLSPVLPPPRGKELVDQVYFTIGVIPLVDANNTGNDRRVVARKNLRSTSESDMVPMSFNAEEVVQGSTASSAFDRTFHYSNFCFRYFSPEVRRMSSNQRTSSSTNATQSGGRNYGSDTKAGASSNTPTASLMQANRNPILARLSGKGWKPDDYLRMPRYFHFIRWLPWYWSHSVGNSWRSFEN